MSKPVRATNNQQLESEKSQIEESIRILREANQDLDSKIASLADERQSLVDDKHRLADKLQFLTGEAGLADELQTEYDVICAFTSLCNVVDSRSVELLRCAASTFDLAQDRRCRIVAVVGLFDKGKTFLINKLFGVNLRSGKLFATAGLSFIWFERQRILMLDTAGVQAPVSCRFSSGPSSSVQPMFDAHSTESLVFEMIPRIAHHIIFVVNDLTWGEQDYISKLNQRFVQSDRRKELIVVHNMRSTRAIEEAEELFTRQIAQLYDGERSHLSNLVYTSDHGAAMPSVHHVGICDDTSVAGERYNGANIRLLMDMLEHRESLGTAVNVVNAIQQELQRLLPLFVNIEPIVGTADSPQLSVTFQSIPEPAVSSEQYVLCGHFEMRTRTPEQRMSMKTKGLDASIGGVIEHDASFRPQVNIFDQIFGDDGERRIIQIECPGVRKEHVIVTARPNGVKICIEKKPTIDENIIKAVEDIRQHYGQFEKEFIFEQETGRFDICDEYGWYLEDGVLTVVLKQEQDRTVSMASRRPNEPSRPDVQSRTEPSDVLQAESSRPDVQSRQAASQGLQGANPLAPESELA